MKFSAYKPKIQSKQLPFLIAMLLSIVAITVLFNPLTTYANNTGGGSMTDESAAGSATVIGGPNYDRTGYLFWVCDTKGNLLSSVRAITSYGGIVDRNGNPLPDSNIQLINRNGVKAVSLDNNAPWGPPYKDGTGRGGEIKQWLLENGTSGHKRAASIIKQWFNEDLANQWERKEAYLVFEPFYWHQVRANGVGTGIWWCDTSYGWGLFQKSFGGIPETGDPSIAKYTNQMYPNCLKLEDCEEIRALGYTAPPTGKKTNSEMSTQGLGCGIGMVWNDTSSINSPFHWKFIV